MKDKVKKLTEQVYKWHSQAVQKRDSFNSQGQTDEANCYNSMVVAYRNVLRELEKINN